MSVSMLDRVDGWPPPTTSFGLFECRRKCFGQTRNTFWVQHSKKNGLRKRYEGPKQNCLSY